MTPRPLRLALIAALLMGSGAHLALLQGGAWAAMAWRASRGASPAAALTRTFDGRHPCAVCLVVKKAAPGGPSLAPAASAPLDMIARSAVSVSAPAPAREFRPFRAASAEGGAPAPLSPPPNPLS